MALDWVQLSLGGIIQREVEQKQKTSQRVEPMISSFFPNRLYRQAFELKQNQG